MIASDTVKLALRNLGEAKLRTSLTMLGVAIGIASLAGMVSLGVGLQDQLVGRFLKSGMFDAITVMPARALGGRGGFGGRGAGQRGPFGALRGGPRGGDAQTPEQPPPTLDDQALKSLAGIADVKDVYPNVRIPVEIKYEQFSEFSSALGIPMSSRDEGAFETPTYGAFFASNSDAACLLSLDLAKRISESEPKDLIGRNLTIAYAGSSPAGAAQNAGAASFERMEATYRIAGIIEGQPTPGLGIGGGQSDLMIPLGKAREIGGDLRSPQARLRDPDARPSYPSLTVKVSRASKTGDVEDQIKEMGFTAFSLNDALQGAKRAFIVLDIVLSLVGSIALAVSSLGIVNTMVMSILERTREIGIMKAIGGSDADIRRIFLVEASAIGLLGGLAGVTLGWLVGRVINFGANLYIQSQGGTPGNLFSLPFWLVGGAIGFSLVVSLIAGSFPAARAARLDPIQALRHD